MIFGKLRDCGEEPGWVQHRSQHEQDDRGQDKLDAAIAPHPTFMTLNSNGEYQNVDSYGEPCEYES